MADVKLEVVDRRTVCRICLDQSDDMISIFESEENDADSSLLLCQKIEKCAGIKIINHTEWPTRICRNCYIYLVFVQRFQTLVTNTDVYLRTYVANPAEEEAENFADMPAAEAASNATLEENTAEECMPEYLVEDYTTDAAISQTESLVQVLQDVDGGGGGDGSNSNMREVNLGQLIEDDYTEIWFGNNAEDIIEEVHELHEDDVEFVDEIPHKQEPLSESENEAAATEFDDDDRGGMLQEFDEHDEVDEENMQQQEEITQSSILNTPTKKTLAIGSDGAALIRLTPQRQQKPTVEKRQRTARDKTTATHICDICGNTYPRKYALEAHMRRHRDERPFECEICHQSFHLNFQLTRHIRKHTGQRPFSCQYCQRSFADRSTMVKHERIHRNERPYSCDTCGKNFTYSSVLKVHQLTHTGEKPFSCGLCNKRFARGHHLRAHLETLLHSSDPRSKMLLTQIKRDYEDDTNYVENSN